MISATHLARSLVRQLIELGVTDVVLSPGSRNAPLSIALYQADVAGLVNLHVRIDERGAGFFALGMSKASGRYVAVVCTSGTAAANYHPAVLEAWHTGVNLLVITADRPARLRRTGANQTTEQSTLYPNITNIDIAESIDLELVLTGGPVHLNVQFDEPLLPADDVNWLAGIHPKQRETSSVAPEEIAVSERGVLVVGHDRAGFAAEEVSDFARELGWPVVAEDPLTFPQSIAHASIFLTDAQVRSALRPTEVVVIGRTTLSRSINAFLAEATNISVIDPLMWSVDTERTATRKFQSIPRVVRNAPEDFAWLEHWEAAAKSAEDEIAATLGWSEQLAVREIAKNLPEGAALFIGSSRPIRDLEAIAQPRTSLSVFANRGLAGIDGNTSTAFGIATEFAQSYAILGDLTFLHDISALVNAPDVSLTIFLIDNNGGGIFSTLPQAGVGGFETIFGTPHNLNLEEVIAGFGLSVERLKSPADISRCIAHSYGEFHIAIVEVPDRESNATRLKELYQSVSNAVRIGSNFD